MKGNTLVKAKTLPDAVVATLFDSANAENYHYAAPTLRFGASVSNPLLDRAFDIEKTHGIRPAAYDEIRVAVLGIDLQRDFCHPPVIDPDTGIVIGGGSLYVGGRSGTGAIDDNKRIAAWAYKHLPLITQWNLTLDTHHAFQIFLASMLRDSDGKPLAPFTLVMADMVERGEVIVDEGILPYIAPGNRVQMRTWAKRQLMHYCSELDRLGKDPLIIWPRHCQLATPGHALVGVISEMADIHAFVRHVPLRLKVKGEHVWSERYSAISEEVRTIWQQDASGQHIPLPGANRDVDFIQMLVQNDMLVFFGQAGSHCDRATMDDIIDWVLTNDPSLAKKIYIAEDGMSPVVTPTMDFTKRQEEALDKFRNAGCNVVKLATPIHEWPNSPFRA